MDRNTWITARPFDVQIVLNGRDISAQSPITRVRYHADGSGTRTLRDGRSVPGRWRFLNIEQTQVEVEGPEGRSRWVIVELGPDGYRKVNMDTGVEFIHRPIER